jgi:signal transduction histidine kinase
MIYQKHILYRNILMICVILFGITSFAQEQYNMDSLQTILKKTGQDTNRVIILSDFGFEKYKLGDYDKSMYYLLMANSLAEKLNYKKGIASSLNRIGNICWSRSKCVEALEYYSKALAIRKQIGDKQGAAGTISNMGNIYGNWGDYAKALEQYLEGLKMREEIHDTLGVAKSLTNIGNIYLHEKNFSRSLEYYFQSQKIYERIDDQYNNAMVLTNIGITYLQMKEYSQSLVYYLKSLTIEEKIGDKLGIANSLNGIGNIYENKNSNEKAIEYFLNANRILSELEDKKGMAETYNSLGNIYEKLNDSEKALNCFRKQMKFAKESGNKENIAASYQSISDHYYKKMDYKNAFDNYKFFSIEMDSFLNESTISKTSEMEAKYQNEKKQKEISILTKDNEIKEILLKKNRIQIFALATGVAVLFLLGFLLYQWNQLQHRQRINAEIVKQQDMQLKTIIETQEKEQNRIAKDLHDGVGQMLSGLKLSLQSVSEEINNNSFLSEKKLHSSIKIVDDAVSEVRYIAHQMMPHALNMLGLIPAIEDMLDKSLSNTNIKFEFEHFNVSGRFEKNIEINLYRVTQELINNCMKHAQASEIILQLFKNENQLVLVMTDNGKGFNADESGYKGLGLMNISTRIKSINGDVKFQPGMDCGTTVTIKIPLT